MLRLRLSFAKAKLNLAQHDKFVWDVAQDE